MHRTAKVRVFKHKSASASLVIQLDGSARLSNLYAKDRGHGHASELMTEIVTFADSANLELSLVARRYGYSDSKSPSNAELAHFYEKYGFRQESRVDGGFFMIRPRSSKPLNGNSN